jgi:hypothetical protein
MMDFMEKTVVILNVQPVNMESVIKKMELALVSVVIPV